MLELNFLRIEYYKLLKSFSNEYGRVESFLNSLNRRLCFCMRNWKNEKSSMILNAVSKRILLLAIDHKYQLPSSIGSGPNSNSQAFLSLPQVLCLRLMSKSIICSTLK